VLTQVRAQLQVLGAKAGRQLEGRAGRRFAVVETLGWSLGVCLAAPSSWVLT